MVRSKLLELVPLVDCADLGVGEEGQEMEHHLWGDERHAAGFRGRGVRGDGVHNRSRRDARDLPRLEERGEGPRDGEVDGPLEEAPALHGDDAGPPARGGDAAEVRRHGLLPEWEDEGAVVVALAEVVDEVLAEGGLEGDRPGADRARGAHDADGRGVRLVDLHLDRDDGNLVELRGREAVGVDVGTVAEVVRIGTSAGVDGEATAQARKYFLSYPPSSPSVALFKEGKLVHFLERHHIEGGTPEMIAENLAEAYNQYC